MLAYLILLFVTVPLAELALLIWVGGKVGLTTTVALVIVTGILGASLARWQGLATLSRFQARLAAGELPHEDLIDGILILVAGAVLLTPGLLTDAVGFLLLVPVVRRGVRRRLLARLKRRLLGGPLRTSPTGAYRPGPYGPGPGGAEPGAAGQVSERDAGTDAVVDADFEVKS